VREHSLRAGSIFFYLVRRSPEEELHKQWMYSVDQYCSERSLPTQLHDAMKQYVPLQVLLSRFTYVTLFTLIMHPHVLHVSVFANRALYLTMCGLTCRYFMFQQKHSRAGADKVVMVCVRDTDAMKLYMHL
jgi:hypothetical protein